MTLKEYIDSCGIVNYGEVDYRLIDHPDYAEWKDSDCFPGHTSPYRLSKNGVLIQNHGESMMIPFDIDGEFMTMEEDNDTMDGFVFTNDDGDRVKLVFWA